MGQSEITMINNTGISKNMQQQNIMPNLKKQPQIYDDDDQPADESKSKIHMQ